MTILRISGIVIGVLLGTYFLSEWLLPSTCHIERSIIVKARPDIIFHEVNNPRNFRKWSPWAKIDPKMTYTFSGPKSGKRAKMSWYSDHEDVGSGTQRIIESIKDDLVVTKLEYGAFEGDFQASIKLDEAGDNTLVTWAYEADMEGNILSRIFGLFMDDMLGPLYEEGLLNLKEVIEAKPIDTFAVEEVITEPRIFLGMEQYVSWEDYDTVFTLFDSFDSTISAYIYTYNVKKAGFPFARYTNYKPHSGVQLIYGIPIEREVEVKNERIKLHHIEGRKAIKTEYHGSYFEMNPIYEMMEVYLTGKNRKMLDEIIHVFVKNKEQEPDSSKWETAVYIPWEDMVLESEQ